MFELYRRKPGRTDTDTPTATIQKGGYLTINEPSYEALGQPGAVALAYNKGRNQMGLKVDDGEYAVPVRKHPTGRSYRINTRSFALHYDLPIDKARKYPAVLDKRQKMLVIDLNAGEPVLRGGIAANEQT